MSRQTLASPKDPVLPGASRASAIACALLALLFSGTVQAVIAPPASCIWLHPVSWVPGLFVISRLKGAKALCAGWLVGASANWAIFYWMTPTIRDFSNLPLAAALAVHLFFGLVSGFYVAVFAAGFGPLRTKSGRWWTLMTAAWFTACEYLNPQLFPYSQAVAWYKVPSVFLITSLTGTPGLTFVIMLGNCVVLHVLEQVYFAKRLSWDGPLRRSIAALFICLAVILSWSGYRLVTIERAAARAGSKRIALVQTNVDVREQTRMIREGMRAIAEDVVALSKAVQSRYPAIDVFVWPEGTLYQSPQSGHNIAAIRFARSAGVEVWTGAACRRRDATGRWSYYNSAFVISREGRVEAQYDKCILVPFGEYLPMASMLPVLRQIQGVGSVTPGTGLQVFVTGDVRGVFLICFETIQHRYVRKGVNLGATLLVNLTYDSWFGRTSAPSQHLMLAAVQAAQYGVPLVRSATSGISAVVDAAGRTVKSLPVFERDVLVCDVKTASVPSLYAALGDWWAWACTIVSVTGLCLGWGRRNGKTQWFGVWLCIALFFLLVPAAWLANPYVPALDWAVWAYVVVAVLWIPLRR